MHLELPKLPEISNWKLFYRCAASSGEIPFVPCQRDQEVTCRDKVSDTRVHSLCLTTRVGGVQIVKWNWGEAVGNCSANTLVIDPI